MKKIIYRFIVVFLVFVFLYFLRVFVLIYATGLYFTPYPHIGTKFCSKEFKISKFNEINIGDTITEVEKKIGKPCYIHQVESLEPFYTPLINKKLPNQSVYVAYYSNDYRNLHFDWESFLIVFDKHNRVVKKESDWVSGD